ncbi:penicillin-binding protein [Candidatus Poribacteria bacterium]|nr:penicillin-binding protein [Candidatus Poribacteria bacterium]
MLRSLYWISDLMKSYKQSIDKHRDPEKSQKIRTFVFLIIMQLCFIFLIYRLFMIQCIKGSQYRDEASVQHYGKTSLASMRGDIYDRNLQPLAIGLNSYSLYADPSNLENWEKIAETLSPIIDIPSSEILGKFKTSKYFVWLKRQLPYEEARRIASLELAGIGFREEGSRLYPKDELAAHVIGFVNMDNVGLEGVEKVYEPYIQGRNQELKSRIDRKGRILRPFDPGYEKPIYGMDTVLTIDEVVQNIAEKELKKACETWQAESGCVIIMDPTTGEIIALANYPTYNLNKAFSFDDEQRRNRAIRDLYEPGSVFKVVTASAALNEELFSVTETIDCEKGVYNFDGRVIHDSHPYDILTFSEVVQKSSNIGITKIASRLGDKRLYEYMKAFGLDDKTGLDLMERKGFVRPLEQWTKHSMQAIPFGHEFAITPLHMLCIINAITNDGIIMKPFIVKAITKKESNIDNLNVFSDSKPSLESAVEFSPDIARIPISQKVSRTMKKILIGVVEDGTGKKAKVKGYQVGGKTGTAQKASKTGGYIPGKYVGSFAGFVSGKDRIISIIVVVNEPRGKHTGGTVACPAFSVIAEQTMQYLTAGQRSYAAR